MGVLQAQAVDLQNIQSLGEEILASCHPDSIITLKSWISVTKNRYEEVSTFMIGNSKLFLVINPGASLWTFLALIRAQVQTELERRTY